MGSSKWRSWSASLREENPITHRAFATPLLIEYQGQHQVISPGADQLHAYDLGHGRGAAACSSYTGFSTVPCPVFSTSRTDLLRTCALFQPAAEPCGMDGKGDVKPQTHGLWK